MEPSADVQRYPVSRHIRVGDLNRHVATGLGNVLGDSVLGNDNLSIRNREQLRTIAVEHGRGDVVRKGRRQCVPFAIDLLHVESEELWHPHLGGAERIESGVRVPQMEAA